jgi:hypothetical protein
VPPLRILFVVEGGALLRFALLLPALAERGHEIHVTFESANAWRRPAPETLRPPPARSLRLVEELSERHPGIHHDLAPRRDPADGWTDVAWLVRGLSDLAHNAHPRYSDAPALRRRARKAIVPAVESETEFEPLARRVAGRIARRLTGDTDLGRSRRVLRLTRRLEDAIPPSREVTAYLRRLKPDVVIATGAVRFVSPEIELLKAARAAGIPTGVFVTSWDNLTNKGSLKFVPDRLFVWNDVQSRDAVELHDIPADRLRATGAHVFDEWFERRPSGTREEFLARIGLDPGQPFLVYLCSSRNIAHPTEVEFVRSWLAALRASGDERLRQIGVLVRPHPNAAEQWQDVELAGGNAVLWPRAGEHPVAAESRVDFVDTLAHSAAVVGINTTAMIEAAILGRPVLTVLVPKFRQEGTLHFHHLLAENGGFLHVADDLDQHVAQLGGVLDDDPEGAERRRLFVESFVRPGGLDQRAAPLGAAAIEELAGVAPARAGGPGRLALRWALGPAAALARAHRRRRRG